MTLRLRFWMLSLGFAIALGVTGMLAVMVGAEPLALYLAHSLGSHPTEPILTPTLVSELGRWIAITAFVGCLAIAVEVDRPTRHR